MCKRLASIFLLMMILGTPKAQSRYKSDRFFTGGGFGLQIGTVTIIDVSPHIGYYLTDNFALGIGGTYQYYRYKDSYYKINYSTDIFGGRLFARYNIIEEIFAHAEYEYLNYEAALIDPLGYFTGDTKRVSVDNVLVGGGYRQNVGGNSWATISVLWNVNETVYTLYSNPIIRMGVDIGF